MEVGRRSLPLQRVQQPLRVDLELLSVCAERRRIFHFNEIAVVAARPVVVGRMVNQHDVADACQRLVTPLLVLVLDPLAVFRQHAAIGALSSPGLPSTQDHTWAPPARLRRLSRRGSAVVPTVNPKRLSISGESLDNRRDG
jgi:hypothetical protein